MEYIDMEMVDIKSFHHPSRLPDHFLMFLGLLPIYIGGNKNRWWPRLVTVCRKWSHSMKISQAALGVLLFFKASLREKHKLNKRAFEPT